MNKQSCFPNNLRQIRKERGILQKDVAKYLGIKNICEISRWEHGIGYPKTVTLFKLSVLYKTPTESFYPNLIQDIISKLEESHLREHISS